MTRSVYVLNGPNLDLLGRRDPVVYGTATLADVEELCRQEADRLGLRLVFRQSNHEGELIDWVHEAFDVGAAVVGNFGAYTHTSIALMDALEVLEAPVVEVHISDIHAREEFRRHSFVGLVADDAVVGQGVEGYRIAIRRVAELLGAGAPDENGPTTR
ncbi:MAG: 3-dehydroquinate dehydratase II [uncultured Nocardioidaceae bacterium]|uniref:3-dehydroquinate dehydratase n=1 Tax=uncultured Nocardioidaceae bacterium TaxID=253824 RepID=A0A6J4MSR4_9ACTN|nr:MAG: 3-dehydroquinate dehydratase II [uncultured Nocardioidaceae bacterium]